ncbi:MAG: MCE family protein [Acidobacteria bacterium]|nr:MCE family protein [Acidobacteriota bacterium]
MPDRSKLRWSQLKVGIIATAALAILAVLIFLLTSSGSIFQHNVVLRTYMDDASGTATKAPVRLNGILIGYVEDIRLSGSKDPNRAVEFVLAIQSRYIRDIPEDSVATVTAASLLGDKFINITKGKRSRPIQAGGELRGMSPQDIPELMAQSANLLNTLQNIVRRVDSMLAGIDRGEGNLGKLLKDEELYTRLNGMASEGEKLLTDVRHGKGTLSKLLYDDALYQEIRAPIKRIDAMLADMQSGQGTAGKLLRDPALYNDAQNSLLELRRVVTDLNAGHGTAGKLLKDDQLYRRMNQLVVRIDMTLDKMNSGQGTLGQLLTNPQLYQSLNGTMREFQSLAKDIRSNPKRFLSIRLTLF